VPFARPRQDQRHQRWYCPCAVYFKHSTACEILDFSLAVAYTIPHMLSRRGKSTDVSH
jgi:hypothetical protein